MHSRMAVCAGIWTPPPVGLCVQYRGTGTGSGLNPIQTNEWRFAIVSDECPECLSGSLDLAEDGDGRFGFAIRYAMGNTMLYGMDRRIAL